MPPVPPSPLNQLLQIAAASLLVHHPWHGRGLAPIGYIKGMAVVYARVYCKLNAGDAAAIEMAKAATNKSDTDALSWYSDQFLHVGKKNAASGVDTLRHLFVLLIGLGMRESSGKYCAGRDKSAKNTTAETAEAGLFQTSFSARRAHPLLPVLFEQYLANPSGFKEVFQEKLICKPDDLKNFGSGDGEDFQRLSKNCPATAAEFAAIGLRNIRMHWGPINRKEAERRPECDQLLQQVQKAVDDSNLCPHLL